MVKVMPRDYQRVLDATRGRTRRGRRSKRRSWRCLVGEPTGFMKYGRQLPRRRPVRVACATGARSTSPSPKSGAPAGRALHGLRHPFCHEGCPLGNLIPSGTTSSIAMILRRHRAAARHQQLPEFTGRLCPAPARCLRARINAEPSPSSGSSTRSRARLRRGWVKPQLPRERTGRGSRSWIGPAASRAPSS